VFLLGPVPERVPTGGKLPSEESALIKIGVFGKCSECNKILKGETAIIIAERRTMEDGTKVEDKNDLVDVVLCLECF